MKRVSEINALRGASALRNTQASSSTTVTGIQYSAFASASRRRAVRACAGSSSSR